MAQFSLGSKGSSPYLLCWVRMACVTASPMIDGNYCFPWWAGVRTGERGSYADCIFSGICKGNV